MPLFKARIEETLTMMYIVEAPSLEAAESYFDSAGPGAKVGAGVILVDAWATGRTQSVDDVWPTKWLEREEEIV